MVAITQLLRNARRKIVNRSFDLILAWYEVTRFTPTDHNFL
jgi:hypothetical protein